MKYDFQVIETNDKLCFAVFEKGHEECIYFHSLCDYEDIYGFIKDLITEVDVNSWAGNDTFPHDAWDYTTNNGGIITIDSNDL